MLNKIKNLTNLAPKAARGLGFALLAVTASLSSCSDMDDYFETPGWLRGSIYQTLTDDGNYSIFLTGAEKAGYRPLMEGKSILTVMAPTDEQMTKYLQANYNTTDITSLSQSELQKLIGFHILYYSFDKEMLVNFRPAEGDGATDEEKLLNAGLYHKFRTRSQDAVTKEYGLVNAETMDSAMVNVYHLERYVPVFSHLMFRTKTIDAAKNYNYFFPGKWRGDGGFNVANAGVDEYAVMTSNGYIYRIDEVLKPLETIYTELQKRPNYSRFLKMYDQYGIYKIDETLTSTYGKVAEGGTEVEDLYQHYHDNGYNMAPIALEWPVSDYTKVVDLASKSYSVFAFSNNAFESFFNDFWGQGGYTSMDDPDLQEPIRDLLLNSFTSESMFFPEEFDKSLVENKVDPKNPVAIHINHADVAQENRVICSNGVFYGCDELTPPAKYGSVTGPAFQNKKYTFFLNMLNASGLTNTLSLETEKYIMLYPSNEQMTAREGYQWKSDGTGTLVKLEGTTETNVGSSTKSATIYAHVASPSDGNTILPTSGKKVIKAFSTDKTLYWYLKDGKLTNSIRFNDLLKYADNQSTEADVWTTFDFIPYRGDNDGWTNGHAYEYKDLLFHGDYDASRYSSYVNLMVNQRSDSSTEFYAWIQLLIKAGLITTDGSTLLCSSNDPALMFIPKTDAVNAAIAAGKIPGITGTSIEDAVVDDNEALELYLKSYFVPLSTAVMSNFPYPGWGENTTTYGGLITLDQDEIDATVATRLNIYDDGNTLSVGRKLRSGVEQGTVKVSNAYDSFPFTFADGPVHILEDVLPFYTGQE